MPASYKHHWSIFKTLKDWKATCLSFADSDVCSEYEPSAEPTTWVFLLPSCVGFQVIGPTQSVSWSVACRRFRSVLAISHT
jgi:hypothetical protein